MGRTECSCDGRCQSAPAGCLLPPCRHERGICGRKQFSSILFLFVHFLALDWNVSQDKIWLDTFYRFLKSHISSRYVDVFSWVGAMDAGLSSCVYIFLLSPQDPLGLQLLLCSPGISCHLTPSIVRTISPHPPLWTSVAFFFISYLLSASRAI